LHMDNIAQYSIGGFLFGSIEEEGDHWVRVKVK
jgi:hypothetical protein